MKIKIQMIRYKIRFKIKKKKLAVVVFKKNLIKNQKHQTIFLEIKKKLM